MFEMFFYGMVKEKVQKSVESESRERKIKFTTGNVSTQPLIDDAPTSLSAHSFSFVLLSFRTESQKNWNDSQAPQLAEHWHPFERLEAVVGKVERFQAAVGRERALRLGGFIFGGFVGESSFASASSSRGEKPAQPGPVRLERVVEARCGVAAAAEGERAERGGVHGRLILRERGGGKKEGRKREIKRK